MPREKSVLMNLPLEVPEETFQQLCKIAASEDPTTKVKSWVRWFLQNYANGGVMLSQSELNEIAETTGVTVSDAKDVIKAVQKSKGKDGAMYVVQVPIDPAFWPNLEETATMQGWTPEELLTDAINTVLSNGWIYQWVPSGGTIHFTEIGRRRLEDLIGKHNITEDDVLAAIEGRLTKTA